MLNKREAKQEGARAGKAAASYAEISDDLIDMWDDGDPAMDDYLPARPNLSGEWAGESMNEILDISDDDDVDDDDVDEIAEIWEDAANEAYDKEILRMMREFRR